MSLLEATIIRIPPIARDCAEIVTLRQDSLTKPQGSLGRIEELSVRIASITGNPRPVLDRAAIFVMAADHGLCEEGLSAYPQEVTRQMVLSFLAGRAAINVLGRLANARVIVGDVGVIGDMPVHPSLHSKKIARGTHNICAGPAMTRKQALASVEAGITIFEKEIREQSFDIIATGDMGIGNTTSSSAIIAAITGKKADPVTGVGTGIDEERKALKIQKIDQAITLNQPNVTDGIDVLTKLGGFEIGAIAGVILASASWRIPVVLDGLISAAGAMIAALVSPLSIEYCIAGHRSTEPGHQHALAWLGLKPLLDLGLRLGEGSGAALALPLCKAACAILNEMATFEEAQVSTKAARK